MYYGIIVYLLECDNGIVGVLENVLIIKKLTLKYSRLKFSVVCNLFPNSSEKKCVCMRQVYLNSNYTII